MPPPGEKLGKIAVVGSGAVGMYYGARLARAGEDVRFLLRRDFTAVREHGMTVRVADGDFHLPRVGAFEDVRQIGAVDVVIVALKATANGVLENLVPPLLNESTAILTLENGLGSDELLAAHFGAERVLGGLCFICLNRVAPAVVACYHPGYLNIGEFGRPAGARAHAIATAFRAAGVNCVVAENLAEARWRKLVWNVPFNGLSIAGGGITTDRILADPALSNEARALMREIQSAARALGFRIEDAFLEQQFEVTAPMGAYKPSSLVDFLEGREVEVEAIWGEPLRRARAAGVGTPRLDALYDKLRSLCATPR